MKTVLKAAFFAGTALLWAGCGGKGGTVIPPPESATITQQPLSQTVPIGETATFTVVVTGTAPLSYQWSENGVVIPGAISASYTTPAVALGAGGSTSVGTFQVTISNPIDSITSNAVTLTAGPRGPKAGDLRYLLYQQVDQPGLFGPGASGAGVVTAGSSGYISNWYDNAVGSPLGLGSSYLCGDNDCGWTYEYQLFPSSLTGLDMYYRTGDYSTYLSDLESFSAPSVVFTSLDLEPAEGVYAVSWVQTTKAGGFDPRQDPIISPGLDQQTQIQTQAALDGKESRVITAASIDTSGNAILFSYGWQSDTTTMYETQTTVVPVSQVLTAATNLARDGYIISAFGGNDTNGYILIGIRVQGDSLSRSIGQTFDSSTPPYYTPVIYLDESSVGVVWEQ